MTSTSATASDLAKMVASEAVRVAEELDQIRTIYGEDCLASVKRALHTEADPSWQSVITKAVTEWETANPRVDFDLTL